MAARTVQVTVMAAEWGRWRDEERGEGMGDATRQSGGGRETFC